MSITTVPGKGTLLALKSTTFIVIGQRVKLDGPDAELKERDTTHLDSTVVSSRPAIPDAGTVSGTLLYDPNDSTVTVNHPMLRDKLFTPSQTLDEWKLTFADGKTTPSNCDFFGYLRKWKLTGMEVEGSLQVEFEIKLSDSIPTWTAGS